MDRVDTGNGVFITAEGLLMYLQPDEAMGLITECAKRFPAGRWSSTYRRSWSRSSPRRECAPPAGTGYRRCRSVCRRTSGRSGHYRPRHPGGSHDLPMPRGRGLVFDKLFPAFWQFGPTKQIRGAYTLLEFG